MEFVKINVPWMLETIVSQVFQLYDMQHLLLQEGRQTIEN